MRRLLLALMMLAFSFGSLVLSSEPASAHKDSFTDNACKKMVSFEAVTTHAHPTYMDGNHIRYWCQVISTQLSPTCEATMIVWLPQPGPITFHNKVCYL